MAGQMSFLTAAQGKVDATKQQLLGAYQMWQAGKARKAAMKAYNENPYEIPEAAIRSVNKYGTLAKGTRMAGQDLMEENLRSDTASALAQARKSATNPSQVLASTVGLYQQQQQAQQQMNAAAVQDYRQRQSAYADAVATIAPYQVERWKWRTLYPIQASLNQASGLEATAWANIGQGMKSSANTTANAATQVGYQQELSNLLGSNTTPSTQQPVQAQFEYQAPQNIGMNGFGSSPQFNQPINWMNDNPYVYPSSWYNNQIQQKPMGFR